MYENLYKIIDKINNLHYNVNKGGVIYEFC